MKKALILMLSLLLSIVLTAQRQLDIQGDPSSTDTVATIKVNYSGDTNVVGLSVISEPANKKGIGGYFYGGWRGAHSFSPSGYGLHGQSNLSRGLYGQSDLGIGVYGNSISSIGVFGGSHSSIGLYGLSQDSTGGFFKGGGGISIELGGANSDYDTGDDDAVIRTQMDQSHGDLVLVSNDEIYLQIDDDNNSTGHFSIRDGNNSTILSLDESGKLNLKQIRVQGDPSSTDTVATIRTNYTGNDEVIGLAVHSDQEADSLPGIGIGGAFYGGRIGLQGTSTSGMGVYAKGSFIGLHGEGSYGPGVQGSSNSSYGVSSNSTSGSGAYIRGGGGIALELGGADSEYGGGTDDAVIRSQSGQADGDLVLVANDVIALHLDDDDNNGSSVLEVNNGGDTKILILDESGDLTITGSYYPSSDINQKEKITSINLDKILDKVTALPISEWQFKGDQTRHIGPMAQDFYAAFGLGKGKKTIATIDADGIALAAIQALKQEIEVLKKENERMKSNIMEIRKELDKSKSL